MVQAWTKPGSSPSIIKLLNSLCTFFIFRQIVCTRGQLAGIQYVKTIRLFDENTFIFII